MGTAAASDSSVQHVFICGSKSIGQYGGYETFVDKLTEQHQHDPSIQYHVACKANGDGAMDESKLSGVQEFSSDSETTEFYYHNAHIFKIPVPNLGPAVAVYYDLAALSYSIRYCEEHRIPHPIFYILACRIGPFISYFKKKIAHLGGKLYVNPDGHEWKRAKWSPPIRKYWKLSEKGMVRSADLIVCDSVNIERYILEEYDAFSPHTTYIAYGADLRKSPLADNDPRFVSWMKEKHLHPFGYYLVVGRFVPENNYETMIREFMKSDSKKDLALITNVNDRFLDELEEKLHFKADGRIKFVGTVYDADLLKKIRECAYGYLHGHEVGGTNPSLLEALSSTDLNLLLNVGFNREVAQNAALYWEKDEGDLSRMISYTDMINDSDRVRYGQAARKRIQDAYSWPFIAGEYKKLWLKNVL